MAKPIGPSAAVDTPSAARGRRDLARDQPLASVELISAGVRMELPDVPDAAAGRASRTPSGGGARPKAPNAGNRRSGMSDDRVARAERAALAQARLEGRHGELDSVMDSLPPCTPCRWCHTQTSPAGAVLRQAQRPPIHVPREPAESSSRTGCQGGVHPPRVLVPRPATSLGSG